MLLRAMRPPGGLGLECPRVTATSAPVFVGGCPRSGTTLVRTMLNSHPELAVPHETLFLVNAYRSRGRWGDLSEAGNRRRLAKWVVRRKKSRAGRLTPDPDELVARMVAAPGTLGSVVGAGFRLYADRHDKPRWGDKRPSYALNLDAVFAMFPDAQYVNIVRDPRAAVASIRKISEQPGRVGWYEDGLVAGTDLWERSQKEAERWKGRLRPEQFHEIQYEQLLEDPAAVLEGIVGFLALDPAGIEPMLTFHQTVDIKGGNIHPLVAKPLTTETVRKWEQELTREEIALVERELGERMARYGYEPVASGVAIPSDLERRLRHRKRFMRRKLARRWLGEQKLRLTYRHSVAAVNS